MFEVYPRAVESNSFEIWMSLIILIFLAYMSRSASDRPDRLNSVLFSGQRTIAVDSRLTFARAISILLVLLSVSFFIVVALERLGFMQDDDWDWFAVVSLSLLIAFSAKLTVLSGLASLFDQDGLVKTYFLQLLLAAQYLAVGLFPLCLLLSFGPQTIVKAIAAFGALCFSAFALFRLAGIFLILQRQARAPLLYIIFYICGLEILPILLGFEVLRRGIAG